MRGGMDEDIGPRRIDSKRKKFCREIDKEKVVLLWYFIKILSFSKFY